MLPGLCVCFELAAFWETCEDSMANRDKNERVVHEIGGSAIRRRHIVRAGMTGAALATVADLSTTAQAQRAEFRFRMQSFLGPGTTEWDVLVPRYVKRVAELSNGRIQIQAFPPGALEQTAGHSGRP